MAVGREGRRVRRVTLQEPLRVTMGSIGSGLRYELQTRDVSSNGFFLEFAKPGRFPFTSSSIMEVWLDLENFGRIFFNGKMARVVFPEDKAAELFGPGIAIRIIQIGLDDEKSLLDFLRSHDELAASSDGDSEGSNAVPPPPVDAAS